ncbi:hypothetical protein FRB94_008853 [Tulasnella sp. JGI-2019a]|nr:hypothetical protein FRB93_002802 [Tulasnella sp. JGI-2019a]KAG8995699.1 hypothetical protein FRB94_008853 [Tulasnella sp. JGI-2019a]
MSEEEGSSTRPAKRQRRPSLPSSDDTHPTSPPLTFPNIETFPEYNVPQHSYVPIPDNQSQSIDLNPPSIFQRTPQWSPPRHMYPDLPAPWDAQALNGHDPSSFSFPPIRPPQPVDLDILDDEILEPPVRRERRRQTGRRGGRGRSGVIQQAPPSRAPPEAREYIHIEDSPPPPPRSRSSPLFDVDDDDDDKHGHSTPSSFINTTQPSQTESGPTQAREYSCPICFSAPTAAVITPCGHVTCGACLFSSVEVAQKRSRSMGYGGDSMLARCPVCRAVIQDWDGNGGGVIGLEFKVAPVTRT